MRFSTLVRVTFGFAMIGATALGTVVFLQSVEYAMYSVAALVLCVGAVLLALEPELRDHRRM